MTMSENEAKLDPVTTPPTVLGERGRAWLLDIDLYCQRANIVRGETFSTVTSWIVEAPWAHPFWHSYLVTVAYLRRSPSHPAPPVIYLADATHELLVMALCPGHPRQPVIDLERTPSPLSPANFCAQFIAADDAEAAARIETSVKAICAGQLSPDTDFHRDWIQLYGNNMVRGEGLFDVVPAGRA